MIIQVNFGPYDTEYFSCSTRVGRKISKLQLEFFDWLYDKEIDHRFWIYQNGEKIAVNYRSNAFIYWLNHHRFKKGIAKARQVNTLKYAKKRIFF